MALDIRRLIRDLQANAAGNARVSIHFMTRNCGLAVMSAALLAAAPAFSDTVKITPTAQEQQYFKTFDAAIAPARAYDLSATEAEKIRDCVKAFAAQDVTKALEIRAGIKDPVGQKLVNWVRLKSGYGHAAEYRAFLDENPAWAERGVLNQRFEELAFTEGGTAANIRDKFRSSAPKTGIGFAAIASAELALGDSEAAREHAREVWREMTIPPNLESGFIERFGKFLTVADHKWRLDHLMMEDIRWAPDRNERAGHIRRQINRLPADAQKLAEARLAVFLHEEGARAEIAKVMYDASGDTGFLYHRIQALRRDKKIDDAVKLMLSAPTDPKLTPNLDEWWAERRTLGYAVLNKGNPKLAYSLVKSAGPLGVNAAKEQGFMAGFIAMRLLKDPNLATGHFADAAKAADGPLSRGRAGYWLGRIAEAGGDTTKAKEHYAQAAKEIDTFYGQLAQLKLNPSNRRITIKLPEPPTPEQIKRFNDLDAVKAVVVARKAGLEPAIHKLLVSGLRSYFETDTEVAMAVHLADALGDTQLALRASKSAIARGQNMLMYSYPVHTFPSFTPLSQPPEPAFLLGITRQETEFNKDTVSGAGAKGLMQVMTVTAQHVCKDYKFSCELDRLLPDTAYNAKIASAYIGDRMREFGGSYILGMAGYNAGPGRAREWIRAFGDPRSSDMDPIDWIERIPLTETREYVTKVLSNVQIYRARLGDEDNALQLDRDLERGRGKTSTPSGPDG